MSRVPFHVGEQRAQMRDGSYDHVSTYAREMIRDHMPEQHRTFFTQLPFIVVTARDASGQPWTTFLSGAPGFISSPDNQTLDIAAALPSTDALYRLIESGAQVGLLGIELDSRRRNRVNGHVLSCSEGIVRFRVSQSFGNCPQYIAQRQWFAEPAGAPPSALRTEGLTEAQIEWVSQADTFFIGSGYDGNDASDESNGLDASHRGGPAGFIQVPDRKTLVFPDYAGNRHFNTIGNLLEDPRVCVLVADFAAGHLLQISGCASVDWDSPDVAATPGAARLITIEVDQVIEQQHVLPIRWRSLADAQMTLTVRDRIEETPSITSFVLDAQDDAPLPHFRAGQYLPLVVSGDAPDQKIERTYSLSGAPGASTYRISVKRDPRGYVSQKLHDKLQPGDVLLANHPAGEFTVEPSSRPLVLVSAGIGVTPMMSMLAEQAEAQSGRPVLFVHGARDGKSVAFAQERDRLLSHLPNSQCRIVFSQPTSDDQAGEEFNRKGRVSVADLDSLLPDSDGVYYLCGPVAFVADLLAGLRARGVPEHDLHYESFG